MEENKLDITNIGTWFRDMEGKIFRYHVYKKVWTPEEMDKKYSDESIYEDGGYAHTAYITNIIEIPNDILIEFNELTEDWDEHNTTFYRTCGQKSYYKLSDIYLFMNDADNGIFEDEEDEEEPKDDYNPEED